MAQYDIIVENEEYTVVSEYEAGYRPVDKYQSEAQLEKVPYMLILGEKESEDGTIVSVRSRDKGDLGSIPTEKFIKDLLAEIESKEHA